MTTLHTMVGAALAAVCLLPFAQQGGAAPPQPTVVGVVDVIKCVESYPRWTRFKNVLEQKGAFMRARLDALKREIDEARARAEMNGTDSADRKQAELEAEVAMLKRDREGKAFEEEFRIEHARFMTVCYQDLGEVIAKIAKARGVQIVHLLHDTEETSGNPLTMKPGDLIQMNRSFELRDVWYASPEVEVTGEVIKELQVWQWKEREGKPANAGGAPTQKPDAPKNEPGTAEPKGGGDPKSVNPKDGG